MESPNHIDRETENGQVYEYIRELVAKDKGSEEQTLIL